MTEVIRCGCWPMVGFTWPPKGVFSCKIHLTLWNLSSHFIMGISNFKEGNTSCSGSWLTLTISCTQNPNGVIYFVDFFFSAGLLITLFSLKMDLLMQELGLNQEKLIWPDLEFIMLSKFIIFSHVTPTDSFSMFYISAAYFTRYHVSFFIYVFSTCLSCG